MNRVVVAALLVFCMCVVFVAAVFLVRAPVPPAAGGVTLTLQLPAGTTAAQGQQLQEALQRRLAAAGFGGLRFEHVENTELALSIPRPDPDDLQRLRRLISRRGLLEFRLCANLEGHAELAAAHEQVVSGLPELEAQLVQTGAAPADERERRELLARLAAEQLLPAELAERWQVMSLFDERDTTQTTREYVLVSADEPVFTSAQIASATVEASMLGTVPRFTLTPSARSRFCQITRAHRAGGPDPRRLALIFDGRLLSSPYIRSEICGGRAVIDGDYSDQEAEDMATLLSTGELPLVPQIVGETVIEPR